MFAIIGAVTWDGLKTGSLVGVRHLRNRLSEISVSRLRKRITQMERYRDGIASFASSDKALYLTLLQYVILMLVMICMAAISFLFEFAAGMASVRPSTIIVGPPGGFVVIAVAILAIAVVLGFYGLTLGELDTPERILKKVSELDSEIAGLKSKLDARLQKRGI